MSDIKINLDGVIAFLVALALSLLLLLGILISSLYGWAKSRRKRGRFVHQAVFPHISGMSLGLVSAIIIMLLILFTDRTPRPHTLNIWLDNWVALWVAAVLLMWPLGVYIWKRHMGTGYYKTVTKPNNSFNRSAD